MARSGYPRFFDAWQTYAASLDMWEPESVRTMAQHTYTRTQETESVALYTVRDWYPADVSIPVVYQGERSYSVDALGLGHLSSSQPPCAPLVANSIVCQKETADGTAQIVIIVAFEHRMSMSITTSGAIVDGT